MNDTKGIVVFLFARLVRWLVFFPALFQGLVISAQEKNIGDYGKSLGIGEDIFGNKLIAPHANKYWIKPGGTRFGSNETISETMAKNKRDGFNTKYADRWERLINRFEKNHLQKTLERT